MNNLPERLEQLDFSQNSRKRETLRTELLQQANARLPHLVRKEKWNMFAFKFGQALAMIAILVAFILGLNWLIGSFVPVPASGGTPTPVPDINQIVTATFQAMTQEARRTAEAAPAGTPIPDITPTLALRPTAIYSQTKQEYIVYGVKTVVFSMSRYEASKQNLPPYKFVNQHTKIFSHDMEKQNASLIFSDETLPIFILNTYGGGDSAIHGIVATAPKSEKLYARMIPRDEFTSFDAPGSLYELSTDGTNDYRKIFDFDDPVEFVISSDGMKIAYISGNNSHFISDNSLIVRDLNSGNEVSRIALGEYKGNLITSISWAPDSKTILMDVGTGDVHVTPEDAYTKTGCYLVDIYNKTMNKLTNPLFQNPMDLTLGYKTDPFGYSYFPNSNRLIGTARKYEGSTYPFVKLYSVDLEGSNLNEIPLEHNEDVWNVKISPNEVFVAYQCLKSICVTNFQDNLSEIVSQPIPLEDGVDQQQTVIGWLEK